MAIHHKPHLLLGHQIVGEYDKTTNRTFFNVDTGLEFRYSKVVLGELPCFVSFHKLPTHFFSKHNAHNLYAEEGMKCYPSFESFIHYANTPMQYTAIFHGCKNVHFQMKIFNIFLIFAQNIDCGYTLEPPHLGGSNEYPQSMFWSKNKNK